MRQFRFIGEPRYFPTLTYGEVLQEHDVIKCTFYNCGQGTVGRIHNDFPKHWERVVYEPTLLLKDTDLGYFAGLVLPSVYKSWGSGHDERVIEETISLAYQLIRQLKEEKV